MNAVGRLRRPRSALLAWLLVAVGVSVLIFANAHLVYVAFTSQPDCVAHARTIGEGAEFRAAKSAC